MNRYGGGGGMIRERAKSVAEVRSYQDALDYLNRGRKDPERRQLASNVWVEAIAPAQAGRIGIRLYDTIILEFNQNGDIEVFTGGFNTMSTWKRINQFTPSELMFWPGRKGREVWQLIESDPYRTKIAKFFEGIRLRKVENGRWYSINGGRA